MRNMALNIRALICRNGVLNPRVYLLLYIFWIPFFGLLYAYAAPGGFFAPYSRMEPSFAAHRQMLQDTLAAAIKRQVSFYPATKLDIGTWRVDPKTIHVADLNATDDSKFNFLVKFNATPISGGTYDIFHLRVTAISRPVNVIIGTHVALHREIQVENTEFQVNNFEMVRMAVMLFSPKEYQRLMLILSLDEEENTVLEQFLAGVSGISDKSPGHFWRMIYLSAVVVTTLGLGDIVPVTPRARFLLGTEVIFGVFTAGLFLNSLANKKAS
jgi:hypothetical protein